MGLFSTTIEKTTGYGYDIMSGTGTRMLNSSHVISIKSYASTKCKIDYLFDDSKDKEGTSFVFSADTVETILGYCNEAYGSNLLQISYYPDRDFSKDAVSIYVNTRDVVLGIDYDNYTLIHVQTLEGTSKFYISETVSELILAASATTTTSTTSTSSTSSTSTSSTSTSSTSTSSTSSTSTSSTSTSSTSTSSTSSTSTSSTSTSSTSTSSTSTTSTSSTSTSSTSTSSTTSTTTSAATTTAAPATTTTTTTTTIQALESESGSALLNEDGSELLPET